MIVVHPYDRTTEMLSALYCGLDYRLIDDHCSSNEIKHILNDAARQERIMMLRHGSDRGLFSREDDTTEWFDRIIIGHQHAHYLRKHSSNIIAVWCNANLFAMEEGLHGLFTGMIISEMGEAEMYNIKTTQEELKEENVKLANRLRGLLDKNILLSDIPQKMKELDDVHSPLTSFNYNNFYYL